MKKRIVIIAVCVFITGVLCGIAISKVKNNSVIKRLVGDIDSIINNGEIINAKEKESDTGTSIYYGKGYYIKVSVGGERKEYSIYYNNKEIWHYAKIVSLVGNRDEDSYKTSFLQRMSEVEYVELEYGENNKRLSNELAILLGSIDDSSIDNGDSTNHNSDRETGEQPYLFSFYDKNDNPIYYLQFKTSTKSIYMYLNESYDYVRMHHINDKEVLEYIVSEVEKYNEEY